tara:strand:- start:572 stop:1930 length:1359 start_codon:yes stop_codon:yes gene_type:complete
VSTFNAIESNTEYQIISAIISNSDRTVDFQVDIKRLITSFQIFEHIEKAYLTAEVIFADTSNIIQDIDFQGGEKLTLEIAQSEETNEGLYITKEFLIDKIENVRRVDEATDAVMLHCVEYHLFKSSIQNISRSYVGRVGNTIKKIMSEYLDKNLLILGDELIDDLKVIIPNLNPIEACNWLKNRALSQSGMPYYLYSVLGTTNLVMRDLGSILEDEVVNKNVPFIYAPSMNSNALNSIKFYNILEFKIADTEDLHSIIKEGLVGGEYYFYNTMTAVPYRVKFDVSEVFRDLARENLLGGRNERFVYAPDYKLNERNISSYDSRSITQISQSGAYANGLQNFRSYQDDDTAGNHKKKIVAASLKSFLTKSPIQITVKGREFLTGDENYTIGKIIRVLFIDNTSSTENQALLKFDSKNSGDYVICAARHVFEQETYTTTLLCGRLGSLEEDFSL